MKSNKGSFIKNKYLANTFKIAISITLLVYFLANCNLNVIFNYVKGISIWIFIEMIFLSIFAVFINSIKWNLLLKKQRLFSLFKLNLISQFYTLILPGQIAGEGMKTFILGKEEKNMGGIAVSVIVDKITGFLGVFILAIFGIISKGSKQNSIILWVMISALIIGICLLFFLQFEFIFKTINLILNRIENSFPQRNKLVHSVQNVILAWHHYSKKPVTLILSILVGILYQLFGVFIFYVISIEIGAHISVIDWFWIFGLLSLALFLPVSIAGIGIRDGTLVGLLGSLYIDTEKALAISFIFFGIQIVSSLIGSIFILKKNLRAS